MPTCKILFFLLLALCTFSGKCDDVLYQQVGGEISMKCGDLSSNSDVEWKLNDIRIVIIRGKTGQKMTGRSHIKDKVRVNDGTLKVPSLETRDSGVYTCVQSGKKYTVHVVSVFAKPGPVLLQSSDAELHCDITGNPTAEVQWQSPSNVRKDKKQVIKLEPVTSEDDGEWTCLVKDGMKFSLKLTVAGLLTKAVEVPEGGKIVLPCSLSQTVSQGVVGGKWKADHLPEVSFPTLMKSGDKGLHWAGENSTKVTFTSGQLSTNYDVTLINAQRSDEGNYECTVNFDGGAELTVKTKLTVVAKPSGGQEVTKVRRNKPAGGGTWTTKDVFGLQLWIWIAIGASSVVLVGLLVLVVLVQRRNKRMKRMKRLRSMRQPLTAKDYCQCQCNRAETEMEVKVLGQRPLPVPRHQRNPRTHPANFSIDKRYQEC